MGGSVSSTLPRQTSANTSIWSVEVKHLRRCDGDLVKRLAHVRRSNNETSQRVIPLNARPSKRRSRSRRPHVTVWFCAASPPAGKLLIPLERRDVRVVEGARLESVCRGNSTVGSNPTLSAITRLARWPERRSSGFDRLAFRSSLSARIPRLRHTRLVRWPAYGLQASIDSRSARRSRHESHFSATLALRVWPWTGLQASIDSRPLVALGTNPTSPAPRL